jgi:hypothetical protein
MTLMVLQVDPNQAGPGLIAFIIVVLLAVATWLLVRSMRNQMRKVPPTFDNQEPAPPSADSSSERQSE